MVYEFDAIRGSQAGRACFTAMVTFKDVARMFADVGDFDDRPAELRAQRKYAANRVPKIAAYIKNNPDTYTMPGIAATVAAEQLTFSGADNVGKLTIPMDADMEVIDGRHRVGAVERLTRENSDFWFETLPLTIFPFVSLAHAQQRFFDLNRHAVKPSKTIGILYDHRDPAARLARDVVEAVPVFRSLTDMEHPTVKRHSGRLFTLAAIYDATVALFRIPRGALYLEKSYLEAATGFWNAAAENIAQWRQAQNRDIDAATLLADFVHPHAVFLKALGCVGHSIMTAPHLSWSLLSRLADIDLRRANPEWDGRCVVAGRMSKASAHVALTANLLKKKMGMELLPTEDRVETLFLESLHQETS